MQISNRAGTHTAILLEHSYMARTSREQPSAPALDSHISRAALPLCLLESRPTTPKWVQTSQFTSALTGKQQGLLCLTICSVECRWPHAGLHDGRQWRRQLAVDRYVHLRLQNLLSCSTPRKVTVELCSTFPPFPADAALWQSQVRSALMVVQSGVASSAGVKSAPIRRAALQSC